MNKKPEDRRSFLKHGAVLGGGLFLARSDSQQARAQGAAQPANETQMLRLLKRSGFVELQKA